RPHRRFFPFLSTAPATSEVYTLSLHDALPISGNMVPEERRDRGGHARTAPVHPARPHAGEGSREDRAGPHGARAARPVDLVLAQDRKSTRLNSSHVEISYAVFCLKKKKI